MGKVNTSDSECFFLGIYNERQRVRASRFFEKIPRQPGAALGLLFARAVTGGTRSTSRGING